MRILLITSLLFSLSLAQWPTAVHSHSFGTSQQVGQAEFPANVLGPLTSPISPVAPAATASQVVSLGKGGHIALTFDPPIINKAGADFIVFENAFYYGPGNALVFDEWMIVSVSNDGTNWTDFAHNTQTGEGMAGRTPTEAFGVDYTDPAASGGDAFDLSLVSMDTVRYVRVTDATQHQPADRLSAELDGIAAVHQAEATARTASQPVAIKMLHAPQGPLLQLSQPVDRVQCFNSAGQLVFAKGKTTPGLHPIMQLSPGLYVIKAEVAGHTLTTKYIQTL